MSETEGLKDRFSQLHNDLVAIGNQDPGNGLVRTMSIKDDSGLIRGVVAVVLPQDFKAINRVPPESGEWSCFSIVKPEGFEIYQVNISSAETTRIISEIGRGKDSIDEVFAYLRAESGCQPLSFSGSEPAAGDQKARLTLDLLQKGGERGSGLLAKKAARLLVSADDDHFSTLCHFAAQGRELISQPPVTFDPF